MMNKKKLSIIAFSGDFDKQTAVFTLATGNVATLEELVEAAKALEDIRQALD